MLPNLACGASAGWCCTTAYVISHCGWLQARLPHWAAKKLRTLIVKSCRELRHGVSFNAKAEVPIAATMRRPLDARIRIGQLHKVDHFRPQIQPGSAIWQLVIWAVIPYCQPCKRCIGSLCRQQLHE